MMILSFLCKITIMKHHTETPLRPLATFANYDTLVFLVCACVVFLSVCIKTHSDLQLHLT